MFLKAYQKHPRKWNKISKSVPGRSEDSVKNRFRTLVKEYGREFETENVAFSADGGLYGAFENILREENDKMKDDLEWVQKLIAVKETKLQEKTKDEEETGIEKIGTKFVNPATLQEVYVGPTGVFIRDSAGSNFWYDHEKGK